MLTAYSGQDSTDWDRCLSKVCLAYNSSVQCSTGNSPFYLMHGREACLLIDIIHDPPVPAVPVDKVHIWGVCSKATEDVHQVI